MNIIHSNINKYPIETKTFTEIFVESSANTERIKNAVGTNVITKLSNIKSSITLNDFDCVFFFFINPPISHKLYTKIKQKSTKAL